MKGRNCGSGAVLELEKYFIQDTANEARALLGTNLLRKALARATTTHKGVSDTATVDFVKFNCEATCDESPDC